MEAIAKGVLSGLGYGLLIGPLFFLNVRLTLGHGYRHGLALVAGAFTSDVVLVLTSWWGAGKLAAISSDASGISKPGLGFFVPCCYSVLVFQQYGQESLIFQKQWTPKYPRQSIGIPTCRAC